MSERMPHNPSEILNGSRVESASQTEIEAYAAKPFMDIAVDIYDANTKIYSQELGAVSEDDKVEIMSSDGMNELSILAEREVAKASKHYQIFGTDHRPNLSRDETMFVDAMRVKAEHDQSRAKVDIDSFWNESQRTNGRVLADMQPTRQSADTAHERTRLINLDRRLTTLALDPESYNENYLPHTSTIGLVGHKALAGDSIKTEEAAWFKLNVKRLEEEKELFDVIAQRFPAQARVHGEKNATENGQEPSIIMPEDATERNKLVQNFFSSPNMEDTPENLAVLNAYLEKQIQMYARLSKEAQVMHQNDGIRYPGNFETFAGRTLVGVPEKGPNRFIFDVVRHRLNNSAMTIGEMQRMKFKEVARIIGLDLEHRFQDYDKYFS